MPKYAASCETRDYGKKNDCHVHNNNSGRYFIPVSRLSITNNWESKESWRFGFVNFKPFWLLDGSEISTGN